MVIYSLPPSIVRHPDGVPLRPVLDSPRPYRSLPVSVLNGVLVGALFLLILLNIYQFLVQRAALRVAEILYVIASNVRAKAQEVRRDGKDVEITEAHLFDIATSARSILRALGRSEESLGPDPALTVGTNGNRMSSDSLLRLTDNILFAVSEENPGAEWDDVQGEALKRFQKKVPNMEPEAAEKLSQSLPIRATKRAAARARSLQWVCMVTASGHRPGLRKQRYICHYRRTPPAKSPVE